MFHVNYTTSSICLLVLLCATKLGESFFLPFPTQTRAFTTQLQILFDPRIHVDSDIVRFPTPKQKVVLRKEAKKRRARDELPILSIPLEETAGDFSEDTKQNILSNLMEHELVLVRGISRDSKKYVGKNTTSLCEDLTAMNVNQTKVSMLDITGFSVLLYSPTLPIGHERHVPLRTSVGQKSIWKKRPKPYYDENGKFGRHWHPGSDD
eukprot:Nitzschia sp. Nitz4//scaffold23_size168460//17841//18464//NITZ4_002203-RA/size168460-processed-gene-0.210-mRNA-1//1//CDS//3329543587//878//frame0